MTESRYETESEDKKEEEKVPAINQFVPFGNGKEEKMGSLIFKAGRDLLENKIHKSAQGIPQTAYSEAEHLEKLSEMYPITLKYNPITLKSRIKSYVAKARAHVKNEGRTGQGQVGNQIAMQEFRHEEVFINLLNDAQKSIIPAKIPKKVFHGANTRYEPTRGLGNKSGAGVTLDLTGETETDVGGAFAYLEENLSCCVCEKQSDVIHLTEAGYLCVSCLDGSVSVELEGEEDQGKSSLTAKKIREEENSREQQAQTEQHKALMEMEFGDDLGIDTQGTSSNEQQTSTKPPKRKGRYDVEVAEDNDDKIGQALERHLLRSELKMDKDDIKTDLEVKKLKKDDIKADLEIEKLRLELLIKRKEFEQN